MPPHREPDPASAAVTLATRALSERPGGPLLVLTGAGISAESGIPTFRGPDGYWTVGSRNHRPEELATAAAFARMPDEIWSWYLWRRAVCRKASPNEAHAALAELERSLGERFVLVTQNVDGLHLRAGNSRERTWQVHGNLDLMRCARECGAPLADVPREFDAWAKERRLGDAERALLRCRACGGDARPHVLWFDECYDETHFRYESALDAAARAALLLVIGTSGATTLPMRIVETVVGRGAPLVVVDPEPSPFTTLAARHPAGAGEHVAATACAAVPPLVAALLRHFEA